MFNNTNLKAKVCKLTQSTLTQGAKSRDRKSGEKGSYVESMLYRPDTPLVKRCSSAFREKIQRDLEALKK